MVNLTIDTGTDYSLSHNEHLSVLFLLFFFFLFLNGFLHYVIFFYIEKWVEERKRNETPEEQGVFSFVLVSNLAF